MHICSYNTYVGTLVDLSTSTPGGPHTRSFCFGGERRGGGCLGMVVHGLLWNSNGHVVCVHSGASMFYDADALNENWAILAMFTVTLNGKILKFANNVFGSLQYPKF